ncbi:hypothetical protein FIBSPDRAFT_1043258 [Athelia psychrophila]|uniref:Uncharacterized protein n=1 Tax=Athelia psychrophila TaxID=1759441 RepID=A0A166LF77_9AGAM|nr:hypothetical protein FIBSPDRAFT_1043258 [Fibularhizoctonia sp. CBS 109695]
MQEFERSSNAIETDPEPIEEALLSNTNASKEATAQAPPRVDFALDSFRDAVDQVSEAHVKFSGHPSVERLNEAIDNLVLEALEHASEAVAAQSDSNTPFLSAVAAQPSDSLLFASMTKPGLTEDHHGLLLDACLHAVIVPLLYEAFFKETVSTVSKDKTDILDELFSRMSEAEPWAVCQRWRALTASATSVMLDSGALEGFASRVEQKVSQRIAWAYGQPTTIFDHIREKILRDITAVVRDAHQLSLVLKRDILSVRTMVTLDAGIDRPFDPQNEQSVWPDMGAKAGDQVIGVYGLGLGKTTSSGQVVQILRPTVITTALLQEIDNEK